MAYSFYDSLAVKELEEMYLKYCRISRLNQLARGYEGDRRIIEREAHAEEIMLGIELTGKIPPGRREELKGSVRLEIQALPRHVAK